MWRKRLHDGTVALEAPTAVVTCDDGVGRAQGVTRVSQRIEHCGCAAVAALSQARADRRALAKGNEEIYMRFYTGEIDQNKLNQNLITCYVTDDRHRVACPKYPTLRATRNPSV